MFQSSNLSLYLLVRKRRIKLLSKRLLKRVESCVVKDKAIGVVGSLLRFLYR